MEERKHSPSSVKAPCLHFAFPHLRVSLCILCVLILCLWRFLVYLFFVWETFTRWSSVHPLNLSVPSEETQTSNAFLYRLQSFDLISDAAAAVVKVWVKPSFFLYVCSNLFIQEKLPNLRFACRCPSDTSAWVDPNVFCNGGVGPRGIDRKLHLEASASYRESSHAATDTAHKPQIYRRQKQVSDYLL